MDAAENARHAEYAKTKRAEKMMKIPYIPLFSARFAPSISIPTHGVRNKFHAGNSGPATWPIKNTIKL